MLNDIIDKIEKALADTTPAEAEEKEFTWPQYIEYVHGEVAKAKAEPEAEARVRLAHLYESVTKAMGFADERTIRVPVYNGQFAVQQQTAWKELTETGKSIEKLTTSSRAMGIEMGFKAPTSIEKVQQALAEFLKEEDPAPAQPDAKPIAKSRTGWTYDLAAPDFMDGKSTAPSEDLDFGPDCVA